MSPSRLRRRTGLLLVGAGACIAVPLTASVSYAEAQIAEVPAPPSVPAAPEAPLPPEAPQAPEAPLPPESPVAPAPPVPPEHGVYSDGTHSWVFETEREFSEADADLVEGQKEIRREIRVVRSNKELSAAERAKLERDLERAAADMERARADIRRSSRETTRAIAEAERAAAAAPQVTETVSSDGVRTIRVTRKSADGKDLVVQEHVIDEAAIERSAMQAAIAGIEGARLAIASSGSLSADVRAEVMAELDAELAELRKEMGAR